MPRIGFQSDGTTPYVYIETESGGGPTICSTAIGMDSTATNENTFKICTAPIAGVTAESTPNISIDPRTNGNLTLAPNGTGSIALNDSNHITSTGGVLQAAITTGDVTATKGTDGQLLVGSSIGAPVWANISAGSGITVTNGHNTISIAASGGSGVTSLAGNSGGALTGALSLVTADATPTFVGSGSTITLDFSNGATQNLILGDAGASISTGTINTGLGYEALHSITSGTENTAMGSTALFSILGSSQNTAVGQAALANLASGIGSNVAIGNSAGGSLTSGIRNTFLGFEAGDAYTSSESNNISIGTGGIGLETTGISNSLVIGSATGSGNFQLSSAYICGIDGVNVGSTAKIVTLGTGGTVNQLGTATLTAGSNITITPGANTITIAASGGGGGITTIDGNSGSATGSTVTIQATDATIGFSGSGATLTLDFVHNQEIGIGSSWPSYGGFFGQNTSFGYNAINAITSGLGNTAVGYQALTALTSSQNNTCIGRNAGAALTDNTNLGQNTIVGSLSGTSLNGSRGHVFLGYNVCPNVASGSYTVAIGATAGGNYSNTESSNIIINSQGVFNESNTLRLGNATGAGNFQLNQSFIAGIQTIGIAGTAVLVSASDQLGVAVSSRKFKRDIQDAGDSSAFLHKLRPVTFVWDKSSSPGLHDAPSTRQIGLIAEEVAEIQPELVGHDKEGQVLNVHYDRLIPMLLNEIQRLEKRIAALEGK